MPNSIFTNTYLLHMQLLILKSIYSNMKKNVFLKSVILLLIGGFITKIISMFIKIVLARLIGTEGMGIYMLISPTFVMLMALASLGFPVAIS